MNRMRCFLRAIASATSALIALSPLVASAQPTFGGSGGNPTGVYCPSVVGFYGRSGAYVDALGLICQDSNGNQYDSPSAGGSGGSPFRVYCPSGLAVGIVGRSGAYIDALQLVCQGGSTLRAGGSGGGPFDYTCSGGRILRGFNLRAGAYIDALQPICQ